MRDAQAMAELHIAAVQAAYAALLPAEYLGNLSIPKRQAAWRKAIELGEPQLQVAVEDGRVVGFVGYDRSRDAGTPSTAGEIWAIYAAPDRWSQGVGLALWDAARDGLEDEGCTTVTVWVPLRNERTLRFHELAGFKRETASAKTVEVGGLKLQEVRLKRSIG